MYSTDVMDDLFYETPEGMADMGYADEFDEFNGFDDAYDGFDAYDQFDAYDEFDASDEFNGFDDAYDEFDGFDEFDAFDEFDGLDYIVAEALGAEDADEFLKKLFGGLKKVATGAAQIAKKAAPVIGKVARGAAPLLSKIPLPQTQAAGKIASVLGKLMADGADELEALDAIADFADYADELDAAAPVIAGLTLRKTMPGISRLPRAQRQKVVKAASKSTKMLGQRQGPKATKAMPPIVQAAKKTAQRTGQPITRTIPKTTAKVAKSPQTARRLANKVGKAAKAQKMGGGMYPTSGGGTRRYNLHGPVSLTIRCRSCP